MQVIFKNLKTFFKRNNIEEKIQENKQDKMQVRTIADRLHDSYRVQEEVEEIIMDLFEKHEPEVYQVLDFSVCSDPYDNSIEIYIKNVMPYPYEPCWEIRDAIYAMGFGTVYWNFADETARYMEEIRGAEPRRYKPSEEVTPELYDKKYCQELWDKWKINGVDRRFNYDDWFPKYARKKK
jgi:hypothetical protein